MADRKTTIRMFTHMIDMMEQHDVMTISCGDPLMELLKDVRELLKEQEAVEPKVIRMNGFGHPVYVCGKCGFLITESMHFCHECGKRIEWEGRRSMDIREIDGLWCDDITFCPERCGWKSCPRNEQNIRDRTIPHSFSVEIPQDCPKQQEGR